MTPDMSLPRKCDVRCKHNNKIIIMIEWGLITLVDVGPLIMPFRQSKPTTVPSFVGHSLFGLDCRVGHNEGPNVDKRDQTPNPQSGIR